jgi:hypothetical protein
MAIQQSLMTRAIEDGRWMIRYNEIGSAQLFAQKRQSPVKIIKAAVLR